jgi:hypothetical protein
MTCCWKCSNSLLHPARERLVRLRPTLGERDCIEMINAISDGTLRQSVPRAFKIFSDELYALCAPLIRSWHGASPRGGPRNWKSRETPTLETMLKRCHLTGAKLVDVLTDPHGAARAAGELEYMKHDIPATVRRRRPAEAAALVRTRLIEEIAQPPDNSLSPFSTLAKSLGVSTGFIRYREPLLCAAYNRRVRIQNCLFANQKRSEVRRALVGGALAAYLAGHFSSQDELVDHICTAHEARKHVVRRQVAWAIKEAGARGRVREEKH